MDNLKEHTASQLTIHIKVLQGEDFTIFENSPEDCFLQCSVLGFNVKKQGNMVPASKNPQFNNVSKIILGSTYRIFLLS